MTMLQTLRTQRTIGWCLLGVASCASNSPTAPHGTVMVQDASPSKWAEEADTAGEDPLDRFAYALDRPGDELPEEAQAIAYPIGVYGADLEHRTHLTGDWGGKRQGLAKNGVLIHGRGTLFGGSVFDGGREEEEDIVFRGELAVKIDGGRAGLWDGSFLHMRGEARTGHSLNESAGTLIPVNAGAVFPPTEPEEDLADLTEFVLAQFLTDQFAVFVGLLQTLDTDLIPNASGRGNEHFQNLSFVLNPVTLTAIPYTSLGVGAFYFPDDDNTISVMVMDTEESAGNDKFDTDEGTTVTGEWYTRYEVGGLPGGQMFGGLYSDSEFVALGQNLNNFLPNIGTLATEGSTWSVYHNAYQMLTSSGGGGSDGEGDLRGWSIASRLGLSDGDPNPIDWIASLMLTGHGVIDSRPDDSVGLGYFFMALSDEQVPSALDLDDEQGVELFYRYAFTPAVALTADLQYVDTGRQLEDDAWVASMRLFFQL